MSELKEASKDFEPYSVGLVHASVCSELSPEETETRMNAEHPTGIASDWTISEETFSDGTPNPAPCNLKPDTHKHYLMVC
jgi:hypothetical protein